MYVNHVTVNGVETVSIRSMDMIYLKTPRALDGRNIRNGGGV